MQLQSDVTVELRAEDHFGLNPPQAFYLDFAGKYWSLSSPTKKWIGFTSDTELGEKLDNGKLIYTTEDLGLGWPIGRRLWKTRSEVPMFFNRTLTVCSRVSWILNK